MWDLALTCLVFYLKLSKTQTHTHTLTQFVLMVFFLFKQFLLLFFIIFGAGFVMG